MTTPVGASTSTSSGVSTTTAGSPPNAMDKDMFLKLLVAQLKYQDPMNPAEGTEFMAQTAQFTVVEKLDALTKQNAELLSANRALGASGLLGKQVVTTGADGVDVTGTVTGVRLEAAGPVLVVGDRDVALTDVKEVRPADG